MKTEVKWFTPESADGERTLKQHAFVHHIRITPYVEEPYNGNKALCSNSGVMNESEEYEPIEKIESEPQRDDCCKVCRRLAAKSIPVTRDNKTKDSMTYPEAKEEVAKKHGYKSWNSIITEGGHHQQPGLYYNEAAELYARSKWDQACEDQKAECDMYHSAQHSCNLNIMLTPKPEFKP